MHSVRAVCFLPFIFFACTPALPEGLVCEQQILVAGDDAHLATALSEAQDGDCVVLRGGEYREAITVDRAVTLAGERDATVTLLGGDHDVALRLRGQGAGAVGLQLRQGTGMGLLVSAGAVQLHDLEIVDFAGGAIGIRCQDAGCAREDGAIVASGLHTRGGAFGLGMDGGQLTLSDSDFREHRSSGLQPGLGFFATGQSHINAQRVEVASSDTGMVLDGAELSFAGSDVQVRDNDDRGLWAQGLRGDSATPALQIQGDSRFENNGYVGLGLYDSVGARVEGATVRSTRAVPVASDLNQIENIGDGLALLAGSAEVEILASQLKDNARAQFLVDQGGSGLRADDATTLAAPANGYEAVVQNTSDAVALPAGTTGQDLGLPLRRDPGLSLPGVQPEPGG